MIDSNYFSVPNNLPKPLSLGPRALPTPTGDGVLMIYQSKIFELSCDSTSCSWTTKAQQFPSGISRICNFQAFYIPEELTTCTWRSCIETDYMKEAELTFYVYFLAPVCYWPIKKDCTELLSKTLNHTWAQCLLWLVKSSIEKAMPHFLIRILQ